MAIQLNISNCELLVSTMTTMFGSGQYKSITMTMYNDSDGTEITKDMNGIPIENRSISSTTTKSEYVDENGNICYGSVTINFADGSYFVSTEVINSHWYALSGVSVLAR